MCQAVDEGQSDEVQNGVAIIEKARGRVEGGCPMQVTDIGPEVESISVGDIIYIEAGDGVTVDLEDGVGPRVVIAEEYVLAKELNG